MISDQRQDKQRIRELLLGFVKTYISDHAAKEPGYGAWVIGGLAHHGDDLGPSTLYPALHTLEREGDLTRAVSVVEGRQRKYDQIMDREHMVLGEARQKIAELVREVLQEAVGS
jgi:PadR family transcriptional regulator PadR